MKGDLCGTKVILMLQVTVKLSTNQFNQQLSYIQQCNKWQVSYDINSCQIQTQYAEVSADNCHQAIDDSLDNDQNHASMYNTHVNDKQLHCVSEKQHWCSTL